MLSCWLSCCEVISFQASLPSSKPPQCASRGLALHTCSWDCENSFTAERFPFVLSLIRYVPGLSRLRLHFFFCRLSSPISPGHFFPCSHSLDSVRKYPIGISDYREIVEDGYFHWDRTMFVKEFYTDSGEVLSSCPHPLFPLPLSFQHSSPPLFLICLTYPTDCSDPASSSLGKDHHSEHGEVLLRH